MNITSSLHNNHRATSFRDLKRTPKSERVPARDVPPDDYKAAFAAKGAAVGSFLGYVAKLASDAVVKYGTALVLAGPVVGPVLAKSFAVAAGSHKLVNGDLKAKGTKGAKWGGVAAGAVAGFVAPVAKMLGIPLKESTLEMGKDFTIKQAVSRIKNFNYSSLPRVGEEGAKRFENALLPGDVILTKNYSSHQVSLVHNIPGIKQYFNRALIYKGDGKAVEALTGASSKDAKSDTGVSTIDLGGHIADQHHIVAVRTKIEPDQVEKLWDATEAFKQSNTSVALRYTNDVVFSSQFVDYVFNRAAPEVKFKSYIGLSKDVLFMDDLAKGKNNKVVAAEGSAQSALDVAMSKFC